MCCILTIVFVLSSPIISLQAQLAPVGYTKILCGQFSLDVISISCCEKFSTFTLKIFGSIAELYIVFPVLSLKVHCRISFIRSLSISSLCLIIYRRTLNSSLLLMFGLKLGFFSQPLQYVCSVFEHSHRLYMAA